MSTKTTELYINQNGRIVCAAHGGYYLQTELERRPDADVVDTPLDNWLRLDDEDVDLENLGCEDCRGDFR